MFKIFTSKELTQKSLTFHQEQKFNKYLEKIHTVLLEQIDRFDKMKFSTDYVARGMGLVAAQQNRKAIFFIYPVPKQQQYICDIEIEINGPCGNKGKIVVPSIVHHNLKWQTPTDYQRSFYMTSKLNSISPTVQGSSFLRRLSLPVYQGSIDDELEIKVKVTSTRAKVSYYPQRIGVYEINLTTRDCHVVGSPYTIPVEISTTSNTNNSNDSDNDSDNERALPYVKRKRKITRIIDKKKLLQDDETLVKIENETSNYIVKNLLMNTNESVPLIRNKFPQEVKQISPTLSPKVVVTNLKSPVQSNVSSSSNCLKRLIKVFENAEDTSTILNNLDLVKCHREKPDNLQDKLIKLGAISSKYDVSQCKLKTDLSRELQNHIAVEKTVLKEVIIEEYRPGFVGRQKMIWQERNKNILDDNISKLNIKPATPEKMKVLLDIFSRNNTIEICNKENSQLEELKGIVKNTRRLFENPSSRGEHKKYVSLSLNNVNDLNPETPLELKEYEKIPSLQERKDKFLEACQSVENIFEKESKIYGQKDDENYNTCLDVQEENNFKSGKSK